MPSGRPGCPCWSSHPARSRTCGPGTARPATRTTGSTPTSSPMWSAPIAAGCALSNATPWPPPRCAPPSGRAGTWSSTGSRRPTSSAPTCRSCSLPRQGFSTRSTPMSACGSWNGSAPRDKRTGSPRNDSLGWNAFPTPQAALSRPHNGRPATVISAFAQQHGDPTGTRSSALNVFIPDALATGRYTLRPETYVRELVVDATGKITAAVYQNETGETFRQEADVFILACGAVEAARLMLLSRSARFPNGIAHGRDMVGRNVTFHEYSSAIGIFNDPIYAWAGADVATAGP